MEEFAADCEGGGHTRVAINAEIGPRVTQPLDLQLTRRRNAIQTLMTIGTVACIAILVGPGTGTRQRRLRESVVDKLGVLFFPKIKRRGFQPRSNSVYPLGPAAQHRGPVLRLQQPNHVTGIAGTAFIREGTFGDDQIGKVTGKRNVCPTGDMMQGDAFAVHACLIQDVSHP